MDTIDNSDRTAPALTDSLNLCKHFLVHFVIAISVVSLWAAADSWLLLTGLGIANFLSIVTAAVAGVVVSTVVHEWFHFSGAKLSGSSYRIPARTGVFVFDYNYANSSIRQFNIMSLAGQLGSWTVVLLLIALLPLDNSGRWMLLAAAIGSAVFGGAIEFPVLLRTLHSKNPLAELNKITAAVFIRSLLVAAASGAIFWYTLS